MKSIEYRRRVDNQLSQRRLVIVEKFGIIHDLDGTNCDRIAGTILSEVIEVNLNQYHVYDLPVCLDCFPTPLWG